MCAIAGTINLNAPAEPMLATMTRRGPDQNGICRREACTLLHARLAVIDPAGGRQPMTLAWGNETFDLVYNGELYNTEELRRELEGLGHQFADRSDTAVVLHSYAQWREDCVSRMNGIFAFAVWENRARRLFLARDRIGVKPLFYWNQGSRLIFASEIKTILASGAVRPELDDQGAAELLLLGPGRTPGQGIFRGIREVLPGYTGVFQDGRLSFRRYWGLVDRPHEENFGDTAAHVRALVTDAIERQMVSDVPIGTFLSGGLDSSLISAVCAERMAGEPLQTFSVDYPDNQTYFHASRFQPSLDRHYISLMQQSLNTAHTWVYLEPEELVGVLEESTRARDLPGMADVDFSLFAFCGKIRQQVTVALSGECADELFGGYPWYRDPEIRMQAGFPWAQNIDRRLAFVRSPALAARGKAYLEERYLQTLAGTDVLPGTSPEEKRMKELVTLNFYWFMQTLLERKDRMSMYHGLEVRVPFCDYRIAEYLYGVPWAFKDYRGREKGLLRQAVEGLLPEEILWRKKSPYPKTLNPRYQQLVSCRMEALLDRDSAPVFELVRKDALRGLLTEESGCPWYGQLMGVPQTIAYMLQLNYWLEAYGVDLFLS